MKTKYLAVVAAVLALAACNNSEMKPDKAYIGPSSLQVEGGHMTPELLLSLGRLSDPQLSPDGKSLSPDAKYRV